MPEAVSRRPPLTVIIAVFNAAATLQNCLDSIASQTVPNIEVIIIDGGSDDGTVSILESNQSAIAYWESKPDRGIFHAWNKGLRHASGEWLCFLGADDAMAFPDSASKLLQQAVLPVRFVSGRGMIIDAQGDAIREFGRPLEWKTARKRNVICHPLSLHHRSLFEQLGPFEEKFRLAADYEFNLRHCRRWPSAFVDRIVVKVGDGGVSRERQWQSAQEALAIQAAHPDIGRMSVFAHRLQYLVELVAVRSMEKLGLYRWVRQLLLRLGVLKR